MTLSGCYSYRYLIFRYIVLIPLLVDDPLWAYFVSREWELINQS